MTVDRKQPMYIETESIEGQFCCLRGRRAGYGKQALQNEKDAAFELFYLGFRNRTITSLAISMLTALGLEFANSYYGYHHTRLLYLPFFAAAWPIGRRIHDMLERLYFQSMADKEQNRQGIMLQSFEPSARKLGVEKQLNVLIQDQRQVYTFLNTRRIKPLLLMDLNPNPSPVEETIKMSYRLFLEHKNIKGSYNEPYLLFLKEKKYFLSADEFKKTCIQLQDLEKRINQFVVTLIVKSFAVGTPIVFGKRKEEPSGFLPEHTSTAMRPILKKEKVKTRPPVANLLKMKKNQKDALFQMRIEQDDHFVSWLSKKEFSYQQKVENKLKSYAIYGAHGALETPSKQTNHCYEIESTGEERVYFTRCRNLSTGEVFLKVLTYSNTKVEQHRVIKVECPKLIASLQTQGLQCF